MASGEYLFTIQIPIRIYNSNIYHSRSLISMHMAFLRELSRSTPTNINLSLLNRASEFRAIGNPTVVQAALGFPRPRTSRNDPTHRRAPSRTSATREFHRKKRLRSIKSGSPIRIERRPSGPALSRPAERTAVSADAWAGERADRDFGEAVPASARVDP